MLFLASFGEVIRLVPLPAPELPAENTKVNGCVPGVSKSASRVSASRFAALAL